MVTVVGHRGAPSLETPENTIESFRRAIEIGVPIFEFDVHLSRDGEDEEMVVIHDGDLTKATKGSVKRHVRELTL